MMVQPMQHHGGSVDALGGLGSILAVAMQMMQQQNQNINLQMLGQAQQGQSSPKCLGVLSRMQRHTLAALGNLDPPQPSDEASVSTPNRPSAPDTLIAVACLSVGRSRNCQTRSLRVIVLLRA